MIRKLSEIQAEIDRKVMVTNACEDVINDLIRVANWYMIDDDTSEDGKREPTDVVNERSNYFRYEACCAAIDAVRKMIDK